MFWLGLPELIIILLIVIGVVVGIELGRNRNKNTAPITGSVKPNYKIDATNITSVTLEGACPDCVGKEQVLVKARQNGNGNTYIYHNKCGWCTERDEIWLDYVIARIGEGYIDYTDEASLVAPWDLRPGMEKVLYNPGQLRR
jgi:hypothetical protein